MDNERADREVWAATERRAAVLVKLPERPSEAEVRTACSALGVSRATLFRWLKRYRETAGPAPGCRGGLARPGAWSRLRHGESERPRREGRSQGASRAGQSRELRRESHQFRSDLSQELRLGISRPRSEPGATALSLSNSGRPTAAIP
jgi:transposase-like protein